MIHIKNISGTLNPADILIRSTSQRNLCTAIFLLLGLMCSHPSWGASLLLIFSPEDQTRKRRTLRESRTLRPCTCHDCADMPLFLYTVHLSCHITFTFACAVRHVFDFRSSKCFLFPEQDPKNFGSPVFPLLRAETGRNFFRETFDGEMHDFPLADAQASFFNVHKQAHMAFRSGCSVLSWVLLLTLHLFAATTFAFTAGRSIASVRHNL